MLRELVQPATGLTVQGGLEAEQQAFIGRTHWERGTREGNRWGHKLGYVDAAEERIEVALRQVRDSLQPHHSAPFGSLGGRSGAVRRLVRGCMRGRF